MSRLGSGWSIRRNARGNPCEIVRPEGCSAPVSLRVCRLGIVREGRRVIGTRWFVIHPHRAGKVAAVVPCDSPFSGILRVASDVSSAGYTVGVYIARETVRVID